MMLSYRGPVKYAKKCVKKTLSGAVAGFILLGGLSFMISCQEPAPNKPTNPSTNKTDDPTGSVGAATKLAFIEQPGGGAAGVPFPHQPKVAIQDASGKTVASASASVTVSIGTNPGSGELLGKEMTVKAVNGVASFAGLSINKSGEGYTLKASSSDLKNLSDGESTAFNVTHGLAAKIVFTSQPKEAVAGEDFTQQPAVAIQDTYGNQVISGVDAKANLTIDLQSGTGTLWGEHSVMAASGLATWSGLSIDIAGPKTLKVTKPDLTSAGGSGPLSVVSATFDNRDKRNPPGVAPTIRARGEDGVVTLSWTASAGATNYNIFRGIKTDSLVQIGTANTNTYKDTTVANGTVYHYAVEVPPLEGQTRVRSTVIQVEPLSPALIQSLSVDDIGGEGALLVSLKASTGASKYTVKYSMTPNSAAQGAVGCTVKSSEETCLVKELKSGTTYYFMVNAANGYSGRVDSPEIEGIPRSAPTLSLAAGDKQITPMFASEGATSFDLSYGESSGSYTVTKKGTISGTAVTDLVNGRTYYFKVTAQFINGSLSSKEVSIAPEESGPSPKAFKITSAIPGAAKVDLVWESSAGATSYTVKYGTKAGSYETTFATGVKDTSVAVTGLENLKAYYFMVTAVNNSGSQNASVEVTAVPAQPTIASIQDITLSEGMNTTKKNNYDVRLVIQGLPPSIEGLCKDSLTVTSDENPDKPLFKELRIGNDAKLADNKCKVKFVVEDQAGGKSATVTVTLPYGSVKATGSFRVTITPKKSSSAAYSVRLAVSDYAGKAMKVRHGSNQALAEVGFDSTGAVSPLSPVTITEVGLSSWHLDQTMAFSAFYSDSSSVFVDTWYDQSGNGNHAKADSPAEEPLIVKSGLFQNKVVFEKGRSSQLSIRYPQNESLDLHEGYSISSVFAQARERGISASEARSSREPVFSALLTQEHDQDSGRTNNIPVAFGVLNSSGLGRFAMGLFTNRWNTVEFSETLIPHQRVAVLGTYDGAEMSFRFNGRLGAKSHVGPVSASQKDFHIGRRDLRGQGDNYPMDLSELVIYKGALSVEQQSVIQSGQRSYFGTP